MQDYGAHGGICLASRGASIADITVRSVPVMLAMLSSNGTPFLVQSLKQSWSPTLRHAVIGNVWDPTYCPLVLPRVHCFRELSLK